MEGYFKGIMEAVRLGHIYSSHSRKDYLYDTHVVILRIIKLIYILGLRCVDSSMKTISSLKQKFGFRKFLLILCSKYICRNVED